MTKIDEPATLAGEEERFLRKLYFYVRKKTKHEHKNPNSTRIIKRIKADVIRRVSFNINETEKVKKISFRNSLIVCVRY